MRLLVVQYLWWSDPFLEFYKQTETGWQLAHRTEVHSPTTYSLIPVLNYYYCYGLTVAVHAGCLQQLEPHMETVPCLTAISVWRRCGETYKGKSFFSP